MISSRDHLNGVLGRLITLEGIDGSGKSTVLRHIASRLREVLPERRIVLTAEPTAGDVGRILRAELGKSDREGSEASAAMRMQELFLFMADHAHHLTETVIPSLENGAIVLSDRYADSTAAYQGVTLRGIVPDPVSWIQSISRPWNVLPDMTLLFLLEPESALKRMQSRSSREKFERLEFLRLVDRNFREIAALEPRRFVFIDAGQSEKAVAKEATDAVLDLVGR
ncbi:MAG: dTMP kinase [Euryarchaeota archaeon]|nr:dTMP kinase [Euryarchaeota archaeon]